MGVRWWGWNKIQFLWRSRKYCKYCITEPKLNVEDLSVLHSQTRKNLNPPQEAIFYRWQVGLSIFSLKILSLPFIWIYFLICHHIGIIFEWDFLGQRNFSRLASGGQGEIQLRRHPGLEVILVRTVLAELQVVLVLLGERLGDVLQAEDEVVLLVIGPGHHPVREQFNLWKFIVLRSCN